MPIRRWYSPSLDKRSEYGPQECVLKCACGNKSASISSLMSRYLVQIGPWFTDWYMKGEYMTYGSIRRSTKHFYSIYS